MTRLIPAAAQTHPRPDRPSTPPSAPGLVHVWSTCHRSRAVRNGLQRSPAVGRSRRSPVRSCGNRSRGRTLIRMRSQVQVLAGPPPSSQVRALPAASRGALAASLGRAGAARRSPSARPVAPPGPPTRASGAATTTHRGRVPSPRTAATRRCSHRALQPAPVPTAPPPRRALHAGLACLVAQRQARPPRPAPTPAARSASHLPLTNATSTASPASRPPGPSIEPSTARQPQEPPPVPVVTVARPPPEVEGYGRVRTDG